MPDTTQQHRSLRLGTPLGDNALILVSLRCEEAVSDLFRLDLECVSSQPDLEFDRIVGQNVTVAVEGPRGTRYFNGIVSRFRQGATSLDLTRYYIEVVPWLWLLSQSADCRIHQDKTAPEIIASIFDRLGFEHYRIGLQGDHPVREYCVQYRETDLAFVSRLMEEEGIWYFFEHQDGKHTLVLADDPAAVEPCPDRQTARFNPERRAVQEDEIVYGLSHEQQVHTTGIALRDYCFETPRAPIEAEREVEAPFGKLQVYDYPGSYDDTDGGHRVAALRMAERTASRETVSGASNCRGLTPGYRVELREHPRRDCNRALKLLRVIHEAGQEGGLAGLADDAADYTYKNRFVAIPADTDYRPPRTTPRPIVHGTQTAVVTGPSGEEIHTDKYGRVKVHFHWDRVSAMDDKSSCWVRVSQGWAGKNWGMNFLPRVGQEVIVDFLEGDPDHPIITGRVHHAEAMPPYTLPADKTISGIRTHSSKGADPDQLNVIRFEDKKGEEQLFVQAERNFDIRVKNDAFETVKADHHLVVERDRLERVGNNRDEKVGADHKESIGKDRHLRIAGKEAIDVTGSRSLTVTGDVIEVCKGAHSRKTTMDDSLSALGVVINATKGITLKCGSSSVVLDMSGISISGNLLTFDGKLTRINSGPGSPASSAVAGSAVRPATPAQAEEADTDDPAETAALRAEQQKSNKGKYGATKAPPHKPGPALVAQPAPLPEGPAAQPPAEEEPETTWIEIELVDCEDNPIAGESYEVELPDGSVAAGATDEKGLARVVGFEPGDCRITFPNLDKDAWESA